MIIVSGPSTVGKNPFIYQACKLYDFNFVIPYTTRTIRSDEVEGKDYFFLSKTEFQSKIQEREIREWDYCLSNYYGYSFAFPGSGKGITHGLSRLALRIKAKYPQNITTIFLMPSNRDIIFNNLKKIYNGKDLLLRETLVEEEICHSKLFDKVFTVSDSALNLFYEEKVKKVLLSEIKNASL
jgi:guanylate kinase